MMVVIEKLELDVEMHMSKSVSFLESTRRQKWLKCYPIHALFSPTS